MPPFSTFSTLIDFFAKEDLLLVCFWLFEKRDLIYFWLFTWPLPNCDTFLWSICDGCEMQAGTTYPSVHLFPSLFGNCMFSNCWDHFFSDLPYFSRLFSFEYPLVLSIFLYERQKNSPNTNKRELLFDIFQKFWYNVLCHYLTVFHHSI